MDAEAAAVRLLFPLHSHTPLYAYMWNGIKNSEYDQEIPQSQTADNPMAPYLIRCLIPRHWHAVSAFEEC